jgi:hypothetical protein
MAPARIAECEAWARLVDPETRSVGVKLICPTMTPY